MVIKKARGFLAAAEGPPTLPAEGWKKRGEAIRTGWLPAKGRAPLSEIRVYRGGERLIDTSNCLINCAGEGLRGIFDLVTPCRRCAPCR